MTDELDDRTRRAMEATGISRRREVLNRIGARANAEEPGDPPEEAVEPFAPDGAGDEYPRDDPETASAPGTGRWVFDEKVVAAFEDMLERSIPNYPDMRRIVTDAACWHVDATGQTAPLIVDLGASRGAGLEPILNRIGARANYIAVEESPPMLAALKERFEPWEGIVNVMAHDLRTGMPPVPLASVVMSVLTLQFVPIEHRHRLLRQAHQSLHPRGAFILVEKVLGETFELDSLETDLYYGLKRENGYTEAAIERKRLSLEGALVPVTARMNEEFLRAAGFTAIDCVWAWCNFRAWIAVKR